MARTWGSGAATAKLSWPGKAAIWARLKAGGLKRGVRSDLPLSANEESRASPAMHTGNWRTILLSCLLGCGRSGHGNLRILFGGYARYTDSTNDLAVHNNRHAAL